MIIDNPIVSGSLNVQNDVTASNLAIASTASAAYFTGSFIGDGTQLSGVTSYTDTDTLDYINSLGVLSGSAQIASDISGSFTSLSSSLEQRITNQENFSQSLDATFATDAQVTSAVSSLNAATSSYALKADISGAFADTSSSLAQRIDNISTDFDDITNKPTLISSSLQFNTVSTPFTGSFTGSFYGDGSNLSGVTSYTDADTLAFINSRAVLSGSIAELTSVTASFTNTGSVTIPHSFNSKNVSISVYDSNDILIIPQEVALISNSAVKLTFGGSTSGFAVVSKGGHIVSGSVPVPQISHVSDTFSSTTSHTVTHNFNTKDVIVSVYENDEVIIPDTVTTDDLNNVTVTFPEAISGRVVVVKAGHIISGSLPFDNITASPFEQSTSAVTASKHIVPSQDQTYDLGSSTLRFRDLYLSSASIYLGNTVISEDNVVTTASLQSVLPSGTLSGSAQIASDISGSFTLVSASIASERLKNTTDTLDGDLTVTGTLTAQTLHVQEITSSVLYTSGSNRFGEDASDVHQFTGSIRTSTDSDIRVGRTLYASHIDSGGGTLNINAGSGFEPLNLGSSYTYTDNLRVGTIYSTAATSSIKIGGDGNVGLGTPSPNAKLHIETGTNNNAGSGIRLNRTGAYYQALELTTNNVVDWSVGQNSNNSFQIYEDGLALTTRFTIKEGGNIGIGTTDPGENLHIFSSASDVLVESNSVGAASRYLLKTTSRQWNIGTNSTVGSGNGLWFYDNNANQYRMFIDTDGNVGIGISTPEQKLHVEGRGIFDSGTSSDIIQFRNDNGGFVIGNTANLVSIDLSSTSNLRIRQGSSIPFYLNSNGNLGIGDLTPDAKVHITTTSSDHLRLAYDNTYYWDIARNATDGRLSFTDNGSGEVVSIKPNGNVGIGVVNDIRAKLHINSSNFIPEQAAISDDSKLVISGVDGNMDLFSTDDNSTVSNSIGFGRYNQSTGALIHKFGIVSWANAGNQGGNTGRKIAFHYGTTKNPWDNTELMHIGSNGYVGIGTTVANAPFDVQQGVRMGRGWHLTGRAGIRLDSDGTTRPADILFGHTAAGDEAGWTGVYWALSSRGSSAGNKFYVYRGSGQPAPNNSEAVLISLDPAMRVGIGEDSPGARLSVNSSDTLVSDFYSPVADQLTYLRIWNTAQSSAGTSTAAAAIELVGKADTSTHGRHAWIGAEGVNGTTYTTQVKFKVRGTVGYNWDGSYEAPTRMVIDGRGYVTKDAQPYFNVQIGTSAITVNTTDAKIPFTVVSHDIGSNFSTANSRFTCPVAGRYLFSLTSSIQEAVSGDYNAMYIRVNGNGTSFRFRTAPTASGIWTGITGSAILNLSAGDYVEIWAYTHQGYMNLQPNETLLTGYLLG